MSFFDRVDDADWEAARLRQTIEDQKAEIVQLNLDIQRWKNEFEIVKNARDLLQASLAEVRKDRTKYKDALEEIQLVRPDYGSEYYEILEIVKAALKRELLIKKEET
jgi:septal ring factor EnvC (AmiA/AmiB activator)